ncbi:MAG: nucleotide exchange factor GrpE, partial [Nanoarchaeota archaeon]
MNKETTEKPTIETTEEKRSIGAEESQDPQCGEEHSESEQSTCAEQECIEEAAEDESNQEQKICELTKTLQLLQADFENYRKRAEKDNAEFKRYATKQLVIDLLPVLDNFELALKSINDPGVKMIYAQLFDIMEKHGLKQINPEGKFDPKQHEALLQEESEKEQNT